MERDQSFVERDDLAASPSRLVRKVASVTWRCPMTPRSVSVVKGTSACKRFAILALRED
jgi:hypothetical protein